VCAQFIFWLVIFWYIPANMEPAKLAALLEAIKKMKTEDAGEEMMDPVAAFGTAEAQKRKVIRTWQKEVLSPRYFDRCKTKAYMERTHLWFLMSREYNKTLKEVSKVEWLICKIRIEQAEKMHWKKEGSFCKRKQKDIQKILDRTNECCGI